MLVDVRPVRESGVRCRICPSTSLTLRLGNQLIDSHGGIKDDGTKSQLNGSDDRRRAGERPSGWDLEIDGGPRQGEGTRAWSAERGVFVEEEG